MIVMRTRGAFVVALCGFVAASLLGADVVKSPARLAAYQNEIRGKASGVYEVGDDLFVHVRMPLETRHNPARMKMKCLLMANDLVQRWAIDLTKTDRENAIPDRVSEGVRKAHQILDAANPKWRFRDWNVKLSGQELSGFDKSSLWFVVIVPRRDVESQIPESWKRAIPDARETAVALRVFLPQILKQDSSSVYSQCGAEDIQPGAAVSAESHREYVAVSARLAEYMKTSDRAASERKSADRLKHPLETVSWTADGEIAKVTTNSSVSVVTNVFVGTSVSTSVCECVQSESSRSRRGVSCRGVLRVEERVSAPEEVVTVRVTTTTATVRRKRRRHVRCECGTPRFEELFLSGGRLGNVASRRCPSGDIAVKAYFDPESTLPIRTVRLREALGENPGDLELWVLYGRCLLAQGDQLGALACFRAACVIDSGNQYALTNLAIVYDRLRCPHLAQGLAVLACGVSNDHWCIKESENLLFKP